MKWQGGKFRWYGALGALAIGQGVFVARAADPLPYKDTTLPFDQRVADLIGRMDLHEKAQQVQMQTVADGRLGIPATNWWSESLHGVGRAGTATIYPEAIGLAATWNPKLIHDIASQIADEARVIYDPGVRYRGLTLWAPTINMARDPRWGRTEETYGEDPYLTSRIAVAYVEGLQGDDPKYLKTVATPKHFAVCSEETGRMNREVIVSDEILRDYYLPAFQACFVEAKAGSTMAAHNGINNVPCHANKWLLTDLLRDQWKFQGAVVSDWSGVTQLIRAHHLANNSEDAAAAAMNAGLDVICDTDNAGYVNAVTDAVQDGKISEKTLDQALARNLLLRFRLGLFDPPDQVPYAHIPVTVLGSKEHQQMALEAARQATVLMKNEAVPKGSGFDKLLPLDLRKVDSIAVIGPFANRQNFGAYSAESPAGPSPTILESLRTRVGERVEINTVNWPDIDGAVRAAAKSTVVVVVVGLNVDVEKEGIDRPNLELRPDQESLLERVVAANPLTIVVLEGGSPIAMEWMKEKVPAIVNIWYPGQQGAVALADVLLGKYNPAGRLPMTYYKTIADLPSLDDYTVTNGRTYMYVKKPVSYPFGYGLSYTTFAYKNLIAPRTVSIAGAIDIKVDIANTGDRAGDEVAQLYVRKVESPHPRPQEQLKGFQRITIAAGQSQTATFHLSIADLGLWNASANQYVVEPGSYELLIGASSADIRQRATIEIQ